MTTNIESLLAHRIKQSTALIARVRPLVESVAATARKQEIGDPVVVLANSMRWSRRLIASLTELNESAEHMARVDPAKTPAEEREMLARLQTELTNLIETVAQLTEALMPRRPGR